MIISASRRTDIPAFFSEWFMQRVREGHCTVVNPYNRRQVSYVSLDPADVDVIAFWTKNPLPLLSSLPELEQRGLRYFFSYTLNGYPRLLEPGLPRLEHCLSTFHRLAEMIGPERVIWRYDPIILSNVTSVGYHLEQFECLVRALYGSTSRVIISIVDGYRKAAYSFRRLAEQRTVVDENPPLATVGELVSSLAQIAQDNGLQIQSCAEVLDLTPYGVAPGKCIDDAYIRDVFGIDVTRQKGRNQRAECGCVVSKDIGMYDTCLHGCAYCYAGTLQAGKRNRQFHHPDSPSLLGRFDADQPSGANREKAVQLKLFE